MKRIALLLVFITVLALSGQICFAEEEYPKPEYTKPGPYGSDWYLPFKSTNEYYVFSAREMTFTFLENRKIRGFENQGIVAAIQPVPGKTIGLNLVSGVIYKCDTYEMAVKVYLKLGREARDNGWEIDKWIPPQQNFEDSVINIIRLGGM